MTTTLKNILSFSALVVGVPSSLPHLLNINGVGKIPRLVFADGGGFTVTADATNVTVTRTTGGASVNVYCEYWHSIEDAEPMPNGISSGLFPFVVSGGTNGSIVTDASFTGDGSNASPLALSTTVTIPDAGRLTVNTNAVAGPTTVTIYAGAADFGAIRGDRIVVANTRNDTAAIRGNASGTFDTTSTGDMFSYGVRGQTTTTKSNVGGGNLYNWGVFGRSGTFGVADTAFHSVGVTGLAFGGQEVTASFYGTSSSNKRTVYGLYTHADYSGADAADWTIGAFGYANSGITCFGVIGSAELSAGQTTQIGVMGTTRDEGSLVSPGGIWAIYSDGAMGVDGALAHKGTTLGFYNTAPIVKQVGVAVTAAAIHAALVNLGLISP